MNIQKNIAIGIITYKRPIGLGNLLKSLSEQRLPESLKHFHWQILIIDNEAESQNEKTIDQARANYQLNISFFRENTRGIPIARNTCVRAALSTGCDALIFIDDDEIAPPGWLAALLTMWEETGGDIITGPVKGILPKNAPAWAKKSKIYLKNINRKRGYFLNSACTNNTLISKFVLQDLKDSFHMVFLYSGSEDYHYFTRAFRKGYKILWCPEALIWEIIPASRIQYRWILKRGIRTGAGYSIGLLLIQPTFATIIRLVYISFSRMGFGILQILLFAFTGWNGLMVGSRNIANGIGGILGMFGITYEEYRYIHKE